MEYGHIVETGRSRGGSFHPKTSMGRHRGHMEYSYTVSGDASCDPVTYKDNIVVEDCKCPSVAITPFASFYNTTGQFGP